MPRRYTKKLKLEQLNNTLNSKKSEDPATDDATSNSDSDFDYDEMDGDFSQRENSGDGKEFENELRQILENTPHFAHFSENKGMSVTLDQEIQVFPTCSITIPVPLYIGNCHTPIVEPCCIRTQVCDEWMRQLQIHLSQHKAQAKKMKQREMKNENKIYDTHIFDMAEHIATQQNPYFRDSYDYYYTGGNIQLMEFEGKTLAMHVSGDKLREIHFSEVNSNAECWKPIHTSPIAQTKSSEIFEIINLDSYLINHGHLFMTRHLKEISLYELKREEPDEDDDDDDEINYELIPHSNFINQDTIFISAAQSMGQAKHLAVACQDRSLRLMDMSTEEQISKFDVCLLKTLKESNSTWAQLLAIDANCFHYAAQPVLLTVDMRCHDTNLNPCFASSLYSQQCETFSCLHRSVNPNLLYVASNHKLHCLDMRQMGKKLSDRSVVTWTHQMNYPPTFMDTFSFEGIEYIALSSALPSDQRLCELKDCLGTMSAPCLPYAPPTLEEALLDARLRGNINIYADLPERVKCCHTGLKFKKIENSKDKSFAELLTSTSIGDVYCQRLSLRDEEEKKEELRTGLHTAEAIRYYANLVEEKIDKRQLKCTEVQHISVLRDILKSDTERIAQDEEQFEADDIIIDYGFEDSDKESENEEEQQQQQSPATNGTPNVTNLSPVVVTPSSQEAAVLSPAEEAAAPSQSKPPPAEPINASKQKTVNRGPWQKSAYELTRYTDMITTRLLNLWDMDDYDQTRDVHIDMIDEKLKKENGKYKKEDRMADWLKDLNSEKPTEGETKDETIVPGTDLLKRYEAKDADYTEVPIPNIEIPSDLTPKIEHNNSTERRPSLLENDEFTVIEYDFEPSTSQKAALKRTAKPKAKHTKGF